MQAKIHMGRPMRGNFTFCGDPDSGTHRWEALKTALKPNATQDLAGAISGLEHSHTT